MIVKWRFVLLQEMHGTALRSVKSSDIRSKSFDESPVDFLVVCGDSGMVVNLHGCLGKTDAEQFNPMTVGRAG
jgi:hypothetical protein